MDEREPRSWADPRGLDALVRAHRGVTDQDIVAGRSTDWTGGWAGFAPALFTPSSTAALAGLVADAHRRRVPLQVQGGNTSLTGGATPYGEAVLSTRGLDRLELDLDSGRATVGAGVTAGALRDALAGSGWELGVDLASRDSATIGGMLSTNAGGLRVLRWGQMGEQLLGVEAVLGTGEVVSHLDPPARDNTAPHWHRLMAGAEGTLGVITAATLRLVRSERCCTALLAVGSVEGAVTVAGRCRRIDRLRSVELMLDEGVELVAGLLGCAPPLDGSLHPAYLLVEAGGEELEVFTRQLAPLVGDVDVRAEAFTDGPGRDRLWQWRERHTEAIAAVGVARKCDVAAPPVRAAELVHAAGEAVRRVAPQAKVVRFGHIAEGSVHVNILDGTDEAEGAVLAAAAGVGGSISAEHGIGRQKRRFLALSRSSAEITHIERLRNAMDPHRILNPNILTRFE